LIRQPISCADRIDPMGRIIGIAVVIVVLQAI